MNKDAYINELKRCLSSLPKEEIEDAISYCEEYFEEATDEAQAIQDLGNPSKFAAQIKADFTIRSQPLTNNEKGIKKQRSMWKTLITIFLGIMALPVAFPFLLVFGGLCLAGLIVVGVFIFIGFILTCIFSFSGITVFIKGIADISTIPGPGLLNMGLGCIGIGLACLFIACIYLLFSKLLPSIINYFTNLYRKKKGVVNHE